MWQRTRASLRSQWRTLVVLALVLALGGGIALTALAGARRTQTAVARFVAYNETDQGGFIYGNVFAPPAAPDVPADSLALAPVEQQVVDLPEVAAYFRAPYLFVTTDPTRNDSSRRINVVGVADAALFRTVDRPILVSGHLPDPADPHGAVINETAARQAHLQVGSTVPLYAFSAEQVANGDVTAGVSPDSSPPAGPTFTVTVAGIIRMPSDVSAVVRIAEKQDVSYEGQQSMAVTPAFVVQLAKSIGTPVSQLPSINLVGVRLHAGASWDAFTTKANAIGGGTINAEAGDVFQTHPAAKSAQRGTRLVAIALVLFGAVVAVVTLLLVGQALSRLVTADADDLAILSALGATRRQLIGIETMRAAVVGIGGAVVGLAVAIAGSTIMPIGLARQAEVHPGVEVNTLILLPGALLIAVVATAAAALAAIRATRWSGVAARPDPHARPKRIASLVGRLPLPVAAGLGVGDRIGVTARGRRTASTVARLGAATAVIAFIASVTIGASIDHMARSARDQGWNWDAVVGNINDQVDREADGGRLLAQNPAISEYSAIAIIAGADQGTAVIDGHTVNSLLAIDPMRGSVHPPLVRGRPPQADDEIVLASGTMHDLHRDIGDTVHIPTPQGDRALRVVGEMIAPAFGGVLTDGAGDGGWISGSVVHEIQATESPTENGPPPTAFVLFAVRYAPGVRPGDAYASLRRDFGRTVLTWLPSTDAINLQSVDRLPVLLAALIAVIGIVTIANTLVASARLRRRDLAVLKTVGLERRQIAATVAWHATSMILVALVVGVPVGLRAGTWIWSLMADGINSPTNAVVPVLTVAAVPVVAIAVTLVTAAAPAWATAQLDAAEVLRSD